MVRNSVLLTQTRVVNDARGEKGEGGVDGKLSQKGAACHPCRGPQSVENYCNGLWAEQDAHGPWSRFFLGRNNLGQRDGEQLCQN